MDSTTALPADPEGEAVATPRTGGGATARTAAHAIAARIKAAGGDATVVTADDVAAAARFGLPLTAFTASRMTSSEQIPACWVVAGRVMAHPGLHGGPTRYLCVSDEGRVTAGQLAVSARQLDAMIASYGEIPEGTELDDGWPALARAAASCLRVGGWMADPPGDKDLAGLVTCWAQHWEHVASAWDLAKRWRSDRQLHEPPPCIAFSVGQQLTLGFPTGDAAAAGETTKRSRPPATPTTSNPTGARS